ncbi:leucine-rich repeat-containing protein 74A-like [Liolophura sinensis]|uniref:leucine-rich repeat-containing protein 74A-like n=1 Tax=Liolophura sinensis TaxID=3198878 RepID=UPI0031596A57
MGSTEVFKREVNSSSSGSDSEIMEPSPTSQDINHMAFFVKVQRESARARASFLAETDSDGHHFSEIDSPCEQETPQKSNLGARNLPTDPGQITREVYMQTCQTLRVIPLTEVSRQFGREKLCLKRSILGARDVKAISNALRRDTCARVLDLSGIFMDNKMVQYVCLMLLENVCIKELKIANNHLTGVGIKCLAEAMRENSVITSLNLSGNNLRDIDSVHVADIIQNGTSLDTLNLSHNEFREDAGKIIGDVLENNTNLKTLDLSWNHIRCRGAINIAKCIQKNSTLTTLNLGWNGFAFGGALAIGEAMEKNTTLTDLDLSCNRIHPPALVQLMKGVVKNKTLIKLNLSHNPITVPFTGVLLGAIRDSPEMALTYLDLDGLIVDEEFLRILDVIESRRLFRVRFEAALPLNQFKRNSVLREFDKKDEVFTLDPIEMLYMLKEKMRAVDFFLKMDKEKNNLVTKVELHKLFKEAGIPVTSASVDKAMDFIDFKRDGRIDLEEFLEADRKIKRHSRAKAAKRAEKASLSVEKENRFSQAFKGAGFNETTGKVEIGVDTQAKAMLEAAMTTESPVPDNVNQQTRNGLLKPLSAKRRASVATLYGMDRRSSISGNTLWGWTTQKDED